MTNKGDNMEEERVAYIARLYEACKKSNNGYEEFLASEGFEASESASNAWVMKIRRGSTTMGAQ